MLNTKELNWAVVATCTAQNNGKEESFERVLATFLYPHAAEDFIKNCLPKERRSSFKIALI